MQLKAKRQPDGLVLRDFEDESCERWGGKREPASRLLNQNPTWNQNSYAWLWNHLVFNVFCPKPTRIQDVRWVLLWLTLQANTELFIWPQQRWLILPISTKFYQNTRNQNQEEENKLSIMGGGTEAFPDLGSHCQHQDCHQLDFLPFKCDGCHKVIFFWRLQQNNSGFEPAHMDNSCELRIFGGLEFILEKSTSR